MNDTQIKYKQYFTPDKLANFMVSIIPDAKIKNVIDLSMGVCGLLDAAKNRWHSVKLLGADIDSVLIKKIKKNSPYIDIHYGDGLAECLADNWPQYSSILSSNKFDLAIANPPFDFYNRDTWSIENNKLQLPIEIRFLLKYIDIIREEGYVCIILPYGFLSLDLYSKLRQYLLTKVSILRIIKLFRNCFSSIDAETCLILFQKKCEKDQNIQKFIKFESINDAYEITDSYTIKCNETNRFDIEYYKAQDNCKNIFRNIFYPIKPLSEFIVNCKRGKTITRHPELLSSNGIRFLHTTDVLKLSIKEKNKKYVLNTNNYFKDAFADFESILIGRVGNACIGKVAIQTYKNKKHIISDCLYCLETTGINVYYLTLYLASKFSQQQLKGMARGSCSRYITQNDLTNIKIVVPSTSLQEYFGNKYKRLLKTSNKFDIEKIQDLLSEMEKTIEKKGI